MNVLSQYGVGTGAGGFVGAFMQDEYVTFGTNEPTLSITDSVIQVVIQGSIDVGSLPEPGKSGQNNTIFMIFLDDTIQFSDPQIGDFCTQFGSFGYHSFFTTAKGNSCYYAVISSCSDDCMRTSACVNNPDCTLDTSLSEPQRLTKTASHEFAELVTDPEEPTGWFSPAFGENEVGDICGRRSEVLAVGREFVTVQQIYSKADDTGISSDQSTYCFGQAASPKPPLNPGPHAIGLRVVMERKTTLRNLLFCCGV